MGTSIEIATASSAGLSISYNAVLYQLSVLHNSPPNHSLHGKKFTLTLKISLERYTSVPAFVQNISLEIYSACADTFLNLNSSMSDYRKFYIQPPNFIFNYQVGSPINSTVVEIDDTVSLNITDA